MILITADVSEITKDLKNYEAIYQFLLENDIFYFDIDENIINVLIYDSEDYFKLSMKLIMAINEENLKAKVYIAHSNEYIKISDMCKKRPQVFKQNNELRENCLSSYSYKRNNHFIIRAHHQMLDSILYSLSFMCLKYERNFGIIYDKYYNELTQKQIANKYNITQAAVSKKLKSSNYEMFKVIVDRL